MKSEKGITMVSLAVYIIAMITVVTFITIATGYFQKNIDVSGQSYDYLAEFTKFETFLSGETNINQNKILEISPEEVSNQNSITNGQIYIAFSSGNQYTYVKENKAIYKNNVKIASEVEQCNFTEKILNGHEAVEVTMKVRDKTRTMNFTLKNW